MNPYNLIFTLLLCVLVKSQVIISNNPNFDTNSVPSSVALYIDSDSLTVQVPRIHLNGNDDKTKIEKPTNGLMVYNTNPENEGLHYWNNGNWNLIKLRTEEVVVKNYSSVHPRLLGYEPIGKGRNAPSSFENNNILFVQQKCVNNPVNGHTYCTYLSKKRNTNTNEPINWNDAFDAAKKLEGYLVTITDQKEWEFINSKFLSINEREFFNSRRIWLGHNKLKTPGNPREFIWITGETSSIDWSTGKYFHNFAKNEPNNENNVEGCSHIWNYSRTKILDWNDTLCNLKSLDPSTTPIYHIFEFNE